jgi:hypothetical protein
MTSAPLPDGDSLKAMLAKPRLFDAEQIQAFLKLLERGADDRLIALTHLPLKRKP